MTLCGSLSAVETMTAARATLKRRVSVVRARGHFPLDLRRGHLLNFEDFYATKPSGLGRGLSIYGAIPEAHQGCHEEARQSG